MKIVIASPFYPPEKGVLGMYAEGVKTALEKQGHVVDVISYGPLKHLPPGVRHIAFFFKTYTAARGSAFVLALDTWSAGIPALFASRCANVPFLVRIGGDFLWETYVERTKEIVRLSEFYAVPRKLSLKEKVIRTGTRYLVRRAVLFFNSKFQRDLWHQNYSFDASRARILENVFPAVHISEAPARRVFVSAGRNIALKNYAELERVFALIRVTYPKAELDTRMLPPNEHRERVRDCYAVIIPSISEASSNTAIDAVAAGKPFIMTDDTGTKERLGDCGLFIDTRSESELEGAIKKIMMPDEYEYLRARIQEFSYTHSWDDIAREILTTI